jgi:hypothetical protein
MTTPAAPITFDDLRRQLREDTDAALAAPPARMVDALAHVITAAERLSDYVIEMSRTIPTVYVMGPTNAGKSTLMDVIRCMPMVATVEVGKMLRAKYPPEHFQGQAAPKHTAAEAIKMCLDGIHGAKAEGKSVAFVDGQPRDIEQARELCGIKNRRVFLVLIAPEDVRTGRAQERDGADPAKLELSLKRMRGDCVGLFDVTSFLLMAGEHVIFRDTSASHYTSWDAACQAARGVGVTL